MSPVNQTQSMILTGRIDITDNLDFVKEVVFSRPINTTVINLDEDLKLESDNVLGGGPLLPPPEAIMAEIDGDEPAYDIIYNMYYDNDHFIIHYVSAIINYLYRGNNLLLYYPDLNPTESMTIPKFLNLFWNRYGIGIGILNQRDCVYDWKCIPMWLNMMYTARMIPTRDFLCKYPTDAYVEEPILELLVNDIRPINKTFQEKKNYVVSLIKKFKEKPDLKIPFMQL